MEVWQTIERPRQLGKFRDQRYQEWDEQFGTNNWQLRWKIGSQMVDFHGACALYEDGFFYFLNSNPGILNQLINEASEVYDNDPTNIASGFDYSIQESDMTHLQDIAIRRSLIRMGTWFQGDRLIQIRGSKPINHPLSPILSPGRIPFHLPDLIEKPSLKGFWQENSVEDFWQSNRYLQRRITT